VTSAAELRAAFDAQPEYVVGLEDEVMLLEPESFGLAERAQEVIDAVAGDSRFKHELPASQLEIITEPVASAADAAGALLDARRVLAARAGESVRFAAAGVHPFSPGAGELNPLPRYADVIGAYGPIARRQLVCALQVHVSVGDAERALAIYNTARAYLPLLAALAANAPFYEGHDTGLASTRPLIGELLPRQGVPPAFDSWEEYAEVFRWGAASGAFARFGMWWWELRMHPDFGTLEFRVPDAQSTVADAEAIAAVIQALVAWLGEQSDAGEPLGAVPTWRIEENRWSACRDGVCGEMADLVSGQPRPTRAWLEELLEALSPFAARFGTHRGLLRASEMAVHNGAVAQRRVAEDGGPTAVARWLAERFLEEPAAASPTGGHRASQTDAAAASQADVPASQADVPASQADVPASQADVPASQADVTASQADDAGS
jgi:carboxylate-amine ligase